MSLEVTQLARQQLDNMDDPKSLLAENTITVISDCGFADQSQFLEWCSSFAEPSKFAYTKTDFEAVSTINYSKNQTVIYPQAGTRWNGHPQGDWHQDVVFADPRPQFTVLYANLAVPQHGATWFADTHQAYCDLSAGYKKLLQNLEIIHYRQPNKRYTQRNWEQEYLDNNLEKLSIKDLNNLKVWFETAFQQTQRPVLAKDTAGNTCIYLSPSKAVQFADWTEEESRPLIDFLAVHMTRPEYIYQHQWQNGQAVIWSNNRYLHYGVYDYQGYDRELWRCHLI